MTPESASDVSSTTLNEDSSSGMPPYLFENGRPSCAEIAGFHPQLTNYGTSLVEEVDRLAPAASPATRAFLLSHLEESTLWKNPYVCNLTVAAKPSTQLQFI